MKYIIFDTNIVVSKKDYFFERELVELASLNRFDEIEICIPEIIKDEIIKKYLDEVKPILKKYNEIIKCNKTLHFLEDKELKKIYREDLYLKYEKKLDMILKNKGISIIEYREDGEYIKEIMKDLVLEKPPFNNSKDSFRDAIILYSIFKFYDKLEEEDSIIFITENEKDFVNLKNNSRNITLYKKIDDLKIKDEYIKKRIQDEKIENKLRELEENIHNINIESMIMKKVNIKAYIKNTAEDIFVKFDENLPYEANIILDSVDDSKKEKIDIDFFNPKEGVILLRVSNKIEYTKILKNPEYESCYYNDDEEFIYQDGNIGEVTSYINAYFNVYEEDIENNIEALDFINITHVDVNDITFNL